MSWAFLLRSTASRVQLLPAPARTLALLAWSLTISTTRRCSSWLMVADSPVLPHARRTSTPLDS